MGIGVYGHPSHEISKYSLQVFQLAESAEEDDTESYKRAGDNLQKDYEPKVND